MALCVSMRWLQAGCMCCSGLWEKWQDAGAPVGAAAEAEEYDAFIDSLLQRPNSAQKPEAPADEPTAPAPEDLPGRQQVSRAPSPMVRYLHQLPPCSSPTSPLHQLTSSTPKALSEYEHFVP